MAAQNNAPLPDGLEIAGYRIVKKIASGGFSIVYLAYDAEGNAVAIKEYLPSALALRQPGELVARHFQAQPAGVPHRPEVLFRRGPGAGADLPSERGAGAELLPRQRNRLHGDGLRIGPLAAGAHRAPGRTRAAAWAKRSSARSSSACARGLREVHANKLLHLDLKPANIYLRTDGTPILLDFGAARQTFNADVPKLHADVHAGLRAARPVLEGGDAGAVVGYLQHRRVDVRLHGRRAAAAGRPAQARRQDGRAVRQAGERLFARAGAHGALVPGARSAGAPAKRVRAAEGAADPMPRAGAEPAEAAILSAARAALVGRFGGLGRKKHRQT